MNEPTFDRQLLINPKNKYTDVQMMGIVAQYAVHGNLKRCHRENNIPYDTLKSWKKSEWWPKLLVEVRNSRQDELDGLLTGVIHQAVEMVAERITKGDTHVDKDGEVTMVPARLRDLVGAAHLLFDKRALLRGDPTAKLQPVTPAEQLDKLAKKFEEFSKQLEEKEIKGTTFHAEKTEEG